MKKFGVLIIFAILVIGVLLENYLLNSVLKLDIQGVIYFILKLFFAILYMFLGLLLAANVSKLARESKIKQALTGK